MKADFYPKTLKQLIEHYQSLNKGLKSIKVIMEYGDDKYEDIVLVRNIKNTSHFYIPSPSKAIEDSTYQWYVLYLHNLVCDDEFSGVTIHVGF